MINFNEKLQCLTFLLYERNSFSLKNISRSTIYIGQSYHTTTVPITISMCPSPVQPKATSREICSLENYIYLLFCNKGDHKPEEPWGVSPKKERNKVIGFKRSIALIGSEQSRVVDERANVKSGLQSGPSVLSPWKPQS